ncbi:DoxX family membrane protein [Corynebacterium lizhenjunii]|uniref:DoxX family membrane protein n=1 Tax=Corynebacterium lizhenjunii TaxID=2709394 RepID=UPI001F39C7C5|nr:DoxX family membrane protein [Corynebacterium lizhenjunii]
MTMNNSGANAQGGPDNARNFDDVDVPAYNPQAGSPANSSQAGSPGRTPQGGSPSYSPQAGGEETLSFSAPSMPPSTPGPASAAPSNPAQPNPAQFNPALGTPGPTGPVPGGQVAGASAGLGVTTAEPMVVPEGQPEPSPEELKAEQARQKRAERKADPRRGTLDLGLLFVRIALGGYLIFASVLSFFAFGETRGLSGLEADFTAQGYAMPQVLSIGVPTVQLLAGVFLLLGLVTPLASMLGLVVTAFSALHALTVAGVGIDVVQWPDAVWLSLVLLLSNVALQFTGPGVISLDFGRSWARRPLASSWVFIIVGAALAVAVWWFGAAVNPLR